MPQRVVIVGGGGFYGRYLVEELLRGTTADLVVASRSPATAPSPRVSVASVDLRDQWRLERLLESAAVVVHCAGPFEHLPTQVVDAAIATATPYVDIAENREFARLVEARDAGARAAGVPVLSGASVAPGMALLFARMLTEGFEHVEAVNTYAAPDTRKHRGNGMFETMLYGAGRPYLEPTAGEPVERTGWGRRRRMDFPPPLGPRRVYSVFGMADLDQVPAALGPCGVGFWAGSEIDLANASLMVAARWRRRVGRPQLERFTPVVRAISWLIGRWGRDEGGVVFEATGTRDGVAAGDRLAIVGVPDGGRIPILLAAHGVEALLDGHIRGSGVLRADEWTTARGLMGTLDRAGQVLWSSQAQPAGGWSPWRQVSTPAPA